jgi:16S rRNA (guanine527-N7)-methyltransferase
MDQCQQKLVEGAAVLGVDINDSAAQLFDSYYRLIESWNQKINLVSYQTEQEIFLRHFLDSLWCSKVIEKECIRVLDLGSGAGFPGLPLKICFPELEMTLLEAQKKRCLFLNEVVVVLKLKEIAVVNGRAEDLGHEVQYREKFDGVVVRAVASLATLAELALPLLKSGGQLIAMKSKEIQQELDESHEALLILGGKIAEVVTYRVDGEAERSLVIIKKIAPTPDKYPRRSGIPARRPLR